MKPLIGPWRARRERRPCSGPAPQRIDLPWRRPWNAPPSCDCPTQNSCMQSSTSGFIRGVGPDVQHPAAPWGLCLALVTVVQTLPREATVVCRNLYLPPPPSIGRTGFPRSQSTDPGSTSLVSCSLPVSHRIHPPPGIAFRQVDHVWMLSSPYSLREPPHPSRVWMPP